MDRVRCNISGRYKCDTACLSDEKLYCAYARILDSTKLMINNYVRPHGFSGYGNDPSALNALTTHQQMTVNYSAPGAPNSFPSSGGGNPFE